MMNLLTVAKVRKAKPGDKLTDGGGLFLKVGKRGASWQFIYRPPGQIKQRVLTLGQFPDMTLDDARTTRGKYKAMIKEGTDPGAVIDSKIEKRRMQNAYTLTNVSKKWFKKYETSVIQKTADDNWRRLQINVLDYLGNRPISDIGPKEMIATLEYVEARGSLYQVKVLCRIINWVYDFAVNSQIIKYNPMAGIKSVFAKHTKKNFNAISPAQLPQFFRDFNKHTCDLQTKYAIRLQMLTMVRIGEAVKAKWSEFDFDKCHWQVPKENMKKRRVYIVPLSKQAVNLLQELKAITGRNEYLFPHRLRSNEHMTTNTPGKAIRSMGYTGLHTTHGNRTVSTTAMIDIGKIRPAVADKCLSHEEIKGAGIGRTLKAYYRETFYPERVPAMQWWADYLDEMEILGIQGKDGDDIYRHV